MTPKTYLNTLNQDYLAIHKTKEGYFWETYMGLSADHEGSRRAETAWTEFLTTPTRIAELEKHIQTQQQAADSEQKISTLTGLQGWLAMFKSHALESEKARALKADLIQFEAELFERQQKHVMTFIDENGKEVEGSLPVLASNVRASDHEQVRQSSHQAFLDLEQWALENGFLALVKLRNNFARSLGYDNFFDYSVVKTEHMTSDELFTILDDFEIKTRDTHLKSLDALAKEKGPEAVKGHNFVYSFSGDAMRDLDPYVPFSASLRRWVESFGRLNIDYSGAELTLDLLDRKGKFQNGFCHGPVPAFVDNGNWVAAKVNFTSNAKPDQIGSGYDGINTLFHEGGHAAHFSNVKMNAPCFSQEFAPTSMAYAETQSMFCDSLLGDADWLKQYARDADGNAAPDTLIKAMIDSKQPFRAYGERSILVVPYFERALYQLGDDQLNAQNVTQLARETEKRILGLEVSPRPLMAIPHLLSDESACAYQGYLLAHMAVYQTRAYFSRKFGYLTDNPEIGPLLAQHYWHKGNSISHNQTVLSLTGEGFNASYLANECNLSAQELWQREQESIRALSSRSRADVVTLNAHIRVVDGAEQLANNRESDTAMCETFESYIVENYGR